MAYRSTSLGSLRTHHQSTHSLLFLLQESSWEDKAGIIFAKAANCSARAALEALLGLGQTSLGCSLTSA